MSPDLASDLAEAERQIPDAAFAAVGIGVDDLTALYRLEAIRGFGPQKFKQLAAAGVACTEAVSDPTKLPFRGKTGQSIDSQLRAQTEVEIAAIRGRAVRQIVAAFRLEARIITYASANYPERLFESNNAVPGALCAREHRRAQHSYNRGVRGVPRDQGPVRRTPLRVRAASSSSGVCDHVWVRPWSRLGRPPRRIRDGRGDNLRHARWAGSPLPS